MFLRETVSENNPDVFSLGGRGPGFLWCNSDTQWLQAEICPSPQVSERSWEEPLRLHRKEGVGGVGDILA